MDAIIGIGNGSKTRVDKIVKDVQVKVDKSSLSCIYDKCRDDKLPRVSLAIGEIIPCNCSSTNRSAKWEDKIKL